MARLTRRRFNVFAAATGVSTAMGFPFVTRAAAPRVVIVGGGFGGATAAKYIRRFDSSVEVTLIEPNVEFVTCPFSNTVIGGMNTIDRITHHYRHLQQHGVNLVHDTVARIDPHNSTVKLASGASISYERLIASPGIEFRWDAVEGYDRAVSDKIPHAWKAGPQTLLLRRQLEAMPEGGLFVISPPVNPFRCPPGPGERISLVAHYFKRHKPKAKIVVLDPKAKFSKQELFREGWQALYPGMIDYRNIDEDGVVERVDARTMTLHTSFDEIKADVINFIPPQQAGRIAQSSGLADATGWCPVDHRTFESTIHPGIHVIGDASLAAPMPKSGFAASTQAKVCAAAVTALLQGRSPGEPKFVNTCYSLVSPDYGISVAMVYGYADGRIVKVKGSGGLSPAGASDDFRQLEADYARGWYDSIMDDILS